MFCCVFIITLVCLVLSTNLKCQPCTLSIHYLCMPKSVVGFFHCCLFLAIPFNTLFVLNMFFCLLSECLFIFSYCWLKTFTTSTSLKIILIQLKYISSHSILIVMVNVTLASLQLSNKSFAFY